MASNIQRFNSVSSGNSIVQSTTIESYINSDDIDKPFTLGEWLVNVNEKLGSPDEYISGHMTYIRDWYTKKNQNIKDIKVSIVNNYARFLKEVLIVLPTAEEHRYISNMDWSSKYDLDIAVPYFSKRLRDIVLYIVEQRERIRFQKVKNSLRGSTSGTQKYIYDHIVFLLESEEYSSQFGSQLPTPKQVARDLRITIDESYDITEDYNNQSIDSVSLSGATSIDSLIFTDFNKAVENILSMFPTTLATQSGDLTTLGELVIEPEIGTDMSLLSALTPGYFTNYTNSIDNLNLHAQKKWVEKYTGTDMYYLSSNATGEYVFDQIVTSRSPEANHLNINVPSVVYSPKDKTINERKLGGLFKHTGIAHAYSLDTTYRIIPSEIEADSYNTFPDPKVYSSKIPGIEFNIDYEWMKADNSNDRLAGHIVQTGGVPRMYPYQSIIESNEHARHGVSRVSDRFDFWEGDNRDVWANEDVYQVLKPLDYTKPTQDRVDDLLLGDKSVTNWETDIHGNEYAMYKQTNNYKQYQPHQETRELTCEVLDGEYFWHDVTWERPAYDTYVDGTSSFRGWPVDKFNEYAYGGYFSPYDCEGFDCFCPCETYRPYEIMNES